MFIKSNKIDDHGHTIKIREKLKLKTKIKEFISNITWKIFLWSIEMTDQEYWHECYKAERNQKCIDNYSNEKIKKEINYKL